MLLRAMPPALVAAIAMSLVSCALLLFTRLADAPPPIRLTLLVWGVGFAKGALLSAGLFELARRLSGTARRCAHAAGAIFAFFVLWRLCRDALVVLDVRSRVDLLRWSMVPYGVLATAAAALIATAVSGWTRAPVASVVSILVVLAQGWIPGLAAALSELFRAHPTFARLYGPVVDLVSTLALIRLITVGVRDREATLADPAAAAGGARLAAVALWLRLVLAVALALPLISALRVSNLPKAVLQVPPLLGIALAVLCAAGLLRLAGSRIEGLPADRLIAGVTLVLWWAGVKLSQLVHAAELGQSYEAGASDAELLEAWSIAGPLLSAAGLALAGTSIAEWAEAHGAQQLRESAVARTIVFAILSTFSVMPMVLRSSREPGFYAITSILSVIGLVAIAGLMSRAAAALAGGPTLPTARVLMPTERRGEPEPAARQDPSTRE